MNATSDEIHTHKRSYRMCFMRDIHVTSQFVYTLCRVLSSRRWHLHNRLHSPPTPPKPKDPSGTNQSKEIDDHYQRKRALTGTTRIAHNPDIIEQAHMINCGFGK